MFEKIAMGSKFIGLAAAAEAAPKVQANRCRLILIEAESLEPLRTIAPAAAAGKQGNLAVAPCGGTVPQAHGCFLISTEGGLKDGMGIHQAGGNQLIRCWTGFDAQAEGLLPGLVVKADEHPSVDQDCTALNRISGATQDAHRIQQQGVVHDVRERLLPCGQSRFRNGR